MTTPFHESQFPYDPTLKLSEMRHYQGPDRLRWIRDRQMAQVMLDLWVNIQKRDQKRRPNPPHWNERKEAAE
jgi:hypothetical protein